MRSPDSLKGSARRRAARSPSVSPRMGTKTFAARANEDLPHEHGGGSLLVSVKVATLAAAGTGGPSRRHNLAVVNPRHGQHSPLMGQSTLGYKSSWRTTSLRRKIRFADDQNLEAGGNSSHTLSRKKGADKGLWKNAGIREHLGKAKRIFRYVGDVLAGILILLVLIAH